MGFETPGISGPVVETFPQGRSDYPYFADISALAGRTLQVETAQSALYA